MLKQAKSQIKHNKASWRTGSASLLKDGVWRRKPWQFITKWTEISQGSSSLFGADEHNPSLNMAWTLEITLCCAPRVLRVLVTTRRSKVSFAPGWANLLRCNGYLCLFDGSAHSALRGRSIFFLNLKTPRIQDLVQQTVQWMNLAYNKLQ